MFTCFDVGCHGDGSNGASHVRNRMKDLLTVLYRHHPRGGEGIHWGEVGPIVEDLQEDMTDDASEETEALEWLNKGCDHSCYFELLEGDLILLEVEDSVQHA